MKKQTTKKSVLLAASMAGLMAVTGAAISSQTAYAADVHCYGVNACKGTGDCGGKGHSCAGKNACKGAGFKSVESKEACLAMDGGSLTPIAG